MASNDVDHVSAAMEYARRGWPVLPLHTPIGDSCSCRQNGCDKPGKHPRTRHGLKDATTREGQIRRWWTKWPDANVGVATGAVSGLLVLDVDDKHANAGSSSLAGLQEKYGALPNTLTALTGTGRHFYFRHPGPTVKNSASEIGAGLDIRGDGGYVVAPPSVHANGNTYSYVDSSASIANLPTWLLNLVCGPTDAPERSSEPVGAIIRIGSRNDALARMSGGLRARSMDRAGIEAELVTANATILEAPLPLAEVRGIAASICRYAAGTPSLPWFPFFTTDWLANDVVRFGTDYQRGWYIQLLVECWRRGGALPDDPAVLWRLAGAASKEAFEKNGDHELVLAEFVRVMLESGVRVLVHPWMADQFDKQARKYQQKCEAGRLSLAKRASVQDRAEHGGVAGMEPRRTTVPTAVGDNQNQSQSQNQSQIQN